MIHRTFVSASPMFRVLPANGHVLSRMPGRAARRGFTLVEMLVVISIIGLLLALSAPSILGSMNASQLTSAGSGLAYKLSLAQQTAISRKQTVEMRLYSYEYLGNAATRGYQLFIQSKPSSATFQSLEPPVYFGDGSIVAATSTTLSPLLQATTLPTQTPTEEPWASKPGCSYRRILFYPDGSTNMRTTLPASFITLVGEKDNDGVGSSAPPNFFTIQIDPVTGRTRTYRP